MDPTPRFRDLTVDAFITRLASAEPVPGGGSAAAVAGSLAASLISMVAVLSEGRPKYAEHAELLASAATAGRSLADRFLALADEDAAAFAGYGVALKMARETEAQQALRAAAIHEAASAASQAPFRTVEACREVVSLAEALAGRSNRNAASDLEVSSLLSAAAARSAAANVYVNLPSIGDEPAAAEMRARTESLVSEIDALAAAVHEVVASGQARSPLAAVPA